ncbi:ABC transporter substrate-binding protein [Bradyrhizobium sp. AUGA SZCCT0431]|uniref:ABC transporter substrate-binding protein n=1 Tax=Bradyrhizobium sp. AUGA SZCCT0431 TaxID=2807674 RepID=UPI001BAC82DC|nr:ABC transporter substrate-binding protein [Bradyrhizobium sp. AUGA SZCCT0431]MBR1142793.1 ABC transporter substrate-binding protein [Bradyrhizobium sp. AUGA SZCCT0431]
MRRREFIGLLGSAAAWPLAARAQHSGKPPTIGYLGSNTRSPHALTGFHAGLKERGYVEGHNVRFEYRWAAGYYDRLGALAADLVQQQVSVLVASGGIQAALAAKAATATIPIVFGHGSDPVRFGLVASLNRPGGNITGITYLTTALESKRLGLLHELVPGATDIAVLINPTNPNAENQSKELKEVGSTLGLKLHFANASSEREFDMAFATIVQTPAGALLVASDPFYFNRREQLIALAARHSIPAMYDFRAYAEAGGLASYGTHLTDAYRQVGIYAARILHGEKPADLPVMQSTRFEFMINLQTAKALGLEIPPKLLARADEVIE